MVYILQNILEIMIIMKPQRVPSSVGVAEYSYHVFIKTTSLTISNMFFQLYKGGGDDQEDSTIHNRGR